ncbi:hypothetical protein EB241_10805 [Erwinia psidii]|uniref:Uncharacterized protein n=1 Tax=Erwinia psidii TaxID=69224 RepID=A0A3N6UQI7_9GAMM|nr:hypothetical protein EB241_10805 [Erwinia psidii]
MITGLCNVMIYKYIYNFNRLCSPNHDLAPGQKGAGILSENGPLMVYLCRSRGVSQPFCVS